MRAMRLALAATVLAATACASTAGVWNDTYANMDQKMLRAEITKTLAADAWTTREENNLLIGQKADGAGHQTAAIFSFQDAGKGSSYEMTGKSGHVVNWLTFGIIGASTKHKTQKSCTDFIEKFNADHPHSK